MVKNIDDICNLSAADIIANRNKLTGFQITKALELIDLWPEDRGASRFLLGAIFEYGYQYGKCAQALAKIPIEEKYIKENAYDTTITKRKTRKAATGAKSRKAAPVQANNALTTSTGSSGA